MGSLADREASTMWESWETKKAREERRALEAKIEDSEQRKRMVEFVHDELNTTHSAIAAASGLGAGGGGGGGGAGDGGAASPVAPVMAANKEQARAALAAVRAHSAHVFSRVARARLCPTDCTIACARVYCGVLIG